MSQELLDAARTAFDARVHFEGAEFGYSLDGDAEEISAAVLRAGLVALQATPAYAAVLKAYPDAAGDTVHGLVALRDAVNALLGLDSKPKIVPLSSEEAMAPSNEHTHSVTGWPHEGTCDCGARAVMLSATWGSATYECRGTPTDLRSAYGPDRCSKVFEVER